MILLVSFNDVIPILCVVGKSIVNSYRNVILTDKKKKKEPSKKILNLEMKSMFT